MPNLAKLMKQAASVQRDMHRLQDELAQKTIEFACGGGAVKATARGDGSIASIKIEPGAIDPADPEMLEDLVLTAVNGALGAAKKMAADEMGKLTAGLGLPGVFGDSK
jgi:nucleoid-associated protein EbfC